MVAWSGKRISSLRLYREAPTNGYEHVPFLVLYCIALYLCYHTVGEQYTEALSKAENLEINILDQQEKLRRAAESFLGSATAAAGPVGTTFTPSFFVPSQWIPGFWPSIFLGTTATLHALFMLLQKWSIKFAALVRHRSEESALAATHAHVTPLAHLGKDELVKIQRSITGGIFFEFHRRKYLYDPKSERFEKVRCRVIHPVEHYVEWRGLPSHKLHSQLKELYGPNQFKMSSPAFMDLYVAQLTSPFTVFQIFSAILWLLDEYWKYSLFNLAMILVFEATTVFTRLKSLTTLKGMGNEARQILVLRGGVWVETSTEDLVPGDLFSLTKGKDDVVPCDALIIRGSAVVNEASLTGESVPQMKDGLVTVKKDMGEAVNIKSTHKPYALFGGTRLLQVSGCTYAGDDSENVIEAAGYALPSDGGCVCYCVRTGFSSSQGKLVRMIENSQANVSGDVRDTVLLLLFLLIFALSASGYVLVKGMQDGTKSKYQLLLHCILIVTSVIPPELPMQTALAVNSSLMALMQLHVFCTEPFRVPVAGKVDTCVFDKTGTITTDELVAVGVVGPSTDYLVLKRAFEEALATRSERDDKGVAPAMASTAGMTPLKGASSAALLVLGGCHSLVLVDGKLAGDPLEEAALKGIKWELLGNPQDVCRPRPEALVDGVLVLDLPGEGRHVELSQVRILARHHFASKLQCMSVVVTVPALEGGFALVKGSPEALQQMCVDVPAAYTQIAADLAMRGMRVIALGYKRLSPSAVRSCIESRSETEASIHFVGFVAFTCRVRKDSAEIVSQLRAGGCKVIMATGDAILTGIHVAREVGITTESKKSIKLLESAVEGFVWSEYGSNQKESASLEKTSLLDISQRCDLCATGAVLSSALDKVPQLRESLHLFSVLARMRPDEKERVLLALKDCGRCTLMMGDGANDVGALKQAHVGIALLSGFGDLNASKEVESKTPKDKATSSVITATTAVSQNQEDFYNSVVISETDKELCALSLHELHRRMRVIGIEPNDYPTAKDAASLVVIYREKAAEVADEKKELVRRIKYSRMTPAEQKAESAREQKEMAQLKQLEFQQEYERLVAKGESWAIVKAMQAVYKNTNDELKKRREKEGTFEGSAGKMATMMESLDSVEDTSLPMIKIGDASVASPFTSRMPSIKSAVDIIRQGRCTLVTTIQMYQILALNCLISAYSLSVLHLDGIKYGDKQMTCLGILMSISFVTISRSKPLQKLSSVTPLKSVFHPALFLSLLGQFAFHLLTLYMLVLECKKLVPEDRRPEFMKEFKPSLLNSVVFLVSAVQQVSVFVVNLKGPPFMGGLIENSPLLWSLTFTFVGTFMCASEYIPQLNTWLQLEPFPSAGFRNMVLAYLACDVVGSFLWDRLMLGIYAHSILRASLESTTKQDVWNIVRKLFWVVLIVYWVASQDYTEVLEEIAKASNSTEAVVASAASATVMQTIPVGAGAEL